MLAMFTIHTLTKELVKNYRDFEFGYRNLLTLGRFFYLINFNAG